MTIFDAITPREWFSIVCLSVVAVTAGTAIFCRNYHENWLQFLGLVGITVWATARVSQLSDLWMTRLPSQGVILHASLALYALGTAIKVWQHRPRNDAPPAAPRPSEVAPADLRRVAGGRR